MEVFRNGKFSLTLQSKDLAKGLRTQSSNPRDNHFMEALAGMVGQEGILATLDQFSRTDTSALSVSFPYPQIFILSNYVLVCTETKIYDYTGGSLVEELTVSAGSTWKVVDFIEYIVLTNGTVTVTRSATSGSFAVDSDLAKASAICNYNGQVIIGGPA